MSTLHPALVRTVHRPVTHLAPASMERRQVAVDRLGLLDTPREERFDRIVRFACATLDAPMASVSLVESTRVWFKAAVGAGDICEVEREESFCGHVIDPNEALVVEDARSSPRFSRLRAVAGPPFVRAYAGHPIVDDQGVLVGAMCVYDTEPRSFDGHQLAVLSDLARWARDEIVFSVEASQARIVQTSLLPDRAPRVPGYRLAADCVPSRTVGGDFYDFQVHGDHLGLTFGDVMGKGTAAALLSTTMRAYVRSVQAQVCPDADLAEVVGATSAAAWSDLERVERFVTLVQVAVDLPSGEVRMVDAGHGLSVIVRADGTLEQVSGAGMPLGIAPDQTWEETRDVLAPGDLLVIFSDGLADVMGPTVHHLGVLADLAMRHDDPADLVAAAQLFAQQRGAADDVTVVALRRDALDD